MERTVSEKGVIVGVGEEYVNPKHRVDRELCVLVASAVLGQQAAPRVLDAFSGTGLRAIQVTQQWQRVLTPCALSTEHRTFTHGCLLVLLFECMDACACGCSLLVRDAVHTRVAWSTHQSSTDHRSR